MNLTTLQLWWLCACAAAVLAARPLSPRAGVAAVALGGSVGALCASLFMPSVSTIALVVGTLSCRALLRPPQAWLGAAAGGFAAGLGAWLLHSDGLAWIGSAPLALAIPLLACQCARSAAFAPLRLREQALCGLTLAAPVVAAWPLLSAGWQSAATLNRVTGSAAIASPPAWVWQLVAVAAAAGILHAMWVRR